MFILMDESCTQEIVKLHSNEPKIGTTVRILIEVKNDTLTQCWHVDENLDHPQEYSVEKYFRMK